MSATGSEPPALDICPHGDDLVTFARNLRVIEIYPGPDAGLHSFVYVPFGLLCSVSTAPYSITHAQIKGRPAPGIRLTQHFSLDVLHLFVQWLYTGKYTELDGPVSPLDIDDNEPDLQIVHSSYEDTMHYSVKAAVLAWHLGCELEVSGFQNYAMARLFAALARPSAQPQLTPALYGYVLNMGYGFSPDCALQDLFIRNWGDTSVVNQRDLGVWNSKIYSCYSFRMKFIKATLLSLGKRREKVLVAEDYFVEAGWGDTE